MENRKLYVSDLDGTLLNSGAVLSQFSLDNLRRLLNEGLQFTVASARAFNEIKPVLGDLPIKLPVIAINGAYLTDYQTEKHLIINQLEKTVAHSIFNIIRSQNLWPFMTTFNGSEDRLYYQTLGHPAMEWFRDALVGFKDNRLTHTRHLAAALNETVIALAVMGDKEPIGELAETLKQQFPGQLENFYFENPYSPGFWWLTIHDKKACKSIALREMMEMLGIRREELTVFGDHINDIGMFKLAGTAVAVANAEPQVKALASDIIGSNNEDSVVRYLMEKPQNHNRKMTAICDGEKYIEV
jgi:Cof subfamily protein (haloacid dehalogenase superfamily)